MLYTAWILNPKHYPIAIDYLTTTKSDDTPQVLDKAAVQPSSPGPFQETATPAATTTDSGITPMPKTNKLPATITHLSNVTKTERRKAGNTQRRSNRGFFGVTGRHTTEKNSADYWKMSKTFFDGVALEKCFTSNIINRRVHLFLFFVVTSLEKEWDAHSLPE